MKKIVARKLLSDTFTPNMNTAQALEFIGNLSQPRKMPCFSYSLPVARCVTGAKLAKVKGSVCNQCYAMRGNYNFAPVKASHERHFEALQRPEWVDAMVKAIEGMESSGFFRWHDSGDVQSVEHLEKLAEIARRLPTIQFWLPTREYGFVSAYVAKHGAFPSNLTVRLSAYMVNGNPPSALASRLGVQTSGVTRKGFDCPASTQGNKCLSCRACWDKNVENVNYKKH